ncbi:uncharacterized protein BO66DRAFT_438959 [Aspergillus aculeatinus CBS 121060]|uniref:Uncharacterized protein n=1 Tax=Aspergillus aculeatinus CBS 121060 TaxID=1448322 RepID=A0ACD1H8C9_9EURO|nr:hypothetical protein BO66DRAFT_438959 [Aspergillus aculeatinus CBS 121060]RAH69885.1 hypothetical protein BO66DRAFT_438959 [Aspergillus aculeatinus CBS 121060]
MFCHNRPEHEDSRKRSTPAYDARGTGVRSSTRPIPSPVPGALGHSCLACGIAWPVPCPNETPPASTKTDRSTTRQHHHQPEEEPQSAVSAASTTTTTAPNIAPAPFFSSTNSSSDNMPTASAKGPIDISACAVAKKLGAEGIAALFRGTTDRVTYWGRVDWKWYASAGEKAAPLITSREDEAKRTNAAEARCKDQRPASTLPYRFGSQLSRARLSNPAYAGMAAPARQVIRESKGIPESKDPDLPIRADELNSRITRSSRRQRDPTFGCIAREVLEPDNECSMRSATIDETRVSPPCHLLRAQMSWKDYLRDPRYEPSTEVDQPDMPVCDCGALARVSVDKKSEAESSPGSGSPCYISGTLLRWRELVTLLEFLRSPHPTAATQKNLHLDSQKVLKLTTTEEVLQVEIEPTIPRQEGHITLQDDEVRDPQRVQYDVSVRPPMQPCAGDGHLEIARDPPPSDRHIDTAISRRRRTALQYAAYCGSEEGVRDLLEHGTYVHATDP